jgi:hypothetical protein
LREARTAAAANAAAAGGTEEAGTESSADAGSLPMGASNSCPDGEVAGTESTDEAGADSMHEEASSTSTDVPPTWTGRPSIFVYFRRRTKRVICYEDVSLSSII